MDDQRKNYIDSETIPKNYRLIMFLAKDVENSNSTNKAGDLLLVNKLQTVPQGTERMLQVDQRHRRATVHLGTHPQ